MPDLPAEQPDGTPAGPTVVVDRAALTAVVTAAVDARSRADGLPESCGAAGRQTRTRCGLSVPVRPRPRARLPRRSGAHVLARAQWLADRRSDPLAGGLLALVALVAAVCAGLAIVVVVLDAAASAPGRGRSLATARVLGMRRRDAASSRSR